MKPLVYLDLFAGVGGFAKGFQDAGLPIGTHYFSEIDKHAIAIYKHQFKQSIHVGDVTTIHQQQIQRPNLITFGFPCQDLSIAGKGAGLEGNRSGLFFEAIKLVDLYRPEVFIFENVKGLFSSNQGKDFQTVLQTIAHLGCYDCEWQLCNTTWFLPQNRERVYFIGHLRGKSTPKVFPFTQADSEFIKRATTTPIIKTLTAGGNSGGHHSAMTLIQQATNFQGKQINNTLRGSSFTSLTEKHNYDVVKIKRVNPNKDFGQTPKQQNRVYNPEGISPCLSNHRGDDKAKIIVRPCLTPDRIEKRQNGRRFKENNEPAFTLNTQDSQGVLIDEQIRKLTEIEWERLQGFPDNWTQYGNYNGVIKEVASTNRYKCLGNAVTTYLPGAIATRLYDLKIN